MVVIMKPGTEQADIRKLAAKFEAKNLKVGITQGVGDGKFDPKTPITHAQMYTFMYRYAMFVEKLNPSVSNIRITVSDKNDIPTWAEDAVKFATQSSLIISSGGRITPNDNALRWELATIIGGFAKKVLGW